MGISPINASGAYSVGEDKSMSPEQQLADLKSQRGELEKQLKADNSPYTQNKLDSVNKRIENLEKRVDKTSEDGECQTCKNRKYQDGSDDPGVSFKTPSKISPGSVASRVRSHEYEHVRRNQAKADREDREIVSQTVTIKNAVCPECGKTYVSGGETVTVTRAKQADKFNVGVADDAQNTGKLLNASA